MSHSLPFWSIRKRILPFKSDNLIIGKFSVFIMSMIHLQHFQGFLKKKSLKSKTDSTVLKNRFSYQYCRIRFRIWCKYGIPDSIWPKKLKIRIHSTAFRRSGVNKILGGRPVNRTNDFSVGRYIIC
jgi:hypothetical protein